MDAGEGDVDGGDVAIELLGDLRAGERLLIAEVDELAWRRGQSLARQGFERVLHVRPGGGIVGEVGFEHLVDGVVEDEAIGGAGAEVVDGAEACALAEPIVEVVFVGDIGGVFRRPRRTGSGRCPRRRACRGPMAQMKDTRRVRPWTRWGDELFFGDGHRDSVAARVPLKTTPERRGGTIHGIWNFFCLGVIVGGCGTPGTRASPGFRGGEGLDLFRGFRGFRGVGVWGKC